MTKMLRNTAFRAASLGGAVATLLMAVAPVFSYGQNNNTTSNKSSKDKNKTSVVKLNKLDVVYPDDNFSGVDIDQKELTTQDRSTYYQKQYLMDPPPPLEEDEEDKTPNLFQNIEDEGAESEDDILYASFDTNIIHYPKIDFNKWNSKDTVTLHLVNHNKGEKFVFPTPVIAIPTSHFGYRGRRRFHYGLDMGLAKGEPIYAAFDGVVRVSVFNRSYGNLIVIRHHNGLETYYAHMSKRIAQVGDQVQAGETIGLCGNTGRSYGSHLHFEMRYMGAALNPENVIDVTKRELKDETLKLTPHSFIKKGSARTGKGENTSVASSGVTYYRVRQGDTLGKIAKKNHTTVRRLCQLNGIRENTVLSIGKRLRVR